MYSGGSGNMYLGERPISDRDVPGYGEVYGHCMVGQKEDFTKGKNRRFKLYKCNFCKLEKHSTVKKADKEGPRQAAKTAEAARHAPAAGRAHVGGRTRLNPDARHFLRTPSPSDSDRPRQRRTSSFESSPSDYPSGFNERDRN